MTCCLRWLIRFRVHRNPADERTFLYRLAFEEPDASHLFLMKVDDTTAPGFLFVDAIRHVKKDKS